MPSYLQQMGKDIPHMRCRIYRPVIYDESQLPPKCLTWSIMTPNPISKRMFDMKMKCVDNIRYLGNYSGNTTFNVIPLKPTTTTSINNGNGGGAKGGNSGGGTTTTMTQMTRISNPRKRKHDDNSSTTTDTNVGNNKAMDEPTKPSPPKKQTLSSSSSSTSLSPVSMAAANAPAALPLSALHSKKALASASKVKRSNCQTALSYNHVKLNPLK